MTAHQHQTQREKTGNYLAFDFSLLSGFKIFTDFLLFMLECSWPHNQQKIFSRELDFCGSYLAFDALA